VRPVAVSRGRDTLGYYIRTHEGETMISIQEALTDLLADLRQVAVNDGADFDDALRVANIHAEAEMAPDYEEGDV